MPCATTVDVSGLHLHLRRFPSSTEVSLSFYIQV